jgi:hypothetical protein
MCNLLTSVLVGPHRALVHTSLGDNSLGLFPDCTLLSNMLMKEIPGADEIDLVLVHETRGKSAFARSLEWSIQSAQNKQGPGPLTGLPNINILRTPSLLEALAP